MLTSEVHEYIERSVLCWLATVDRHGCPNVSPKEVFSGYGKDRLLIANIASPNSVRNVLANGGVCVSFVDIFVQKGFKLQGRGRIVKNTEPEYADLVKPLVVITKGVFPIHGIIEIRVEKVVPIRAPSYQLSEGTTEEAQRQSAMLTYGVCPRVLGDRAP